MSEFLELPTGSITGNTQNIKGHVVLYITIAICSSTFCRKTKCMHTWIFTHHSIILWLGFSMTFRFRDICSSWNDIPDATVAINSGRRDRLLKRNVLQHPLVERNISSRFLRKTEAKTRGAPGWFLVFEIKLNINIYESTVQCEQSFIFQKGVQDSPWGGGHRPSEGHQPYILPSQDSPWGGGSDHLRDTNIKLC